MADRELNLQIELCHWLNTVHPSVYYLSELSGRYTTKAMAGKTKALRKYKGHPDLAILESCQNYPQLLLELKVSERDVFLKRGGLPAGKKATHLLEQAAMILMLRDKGYAADLVIGRGEAEWAIESYLDGYLSYTVNVDRIISEATEDQILLAALGHPVVYDYVYNNNAIGDLL